MTTETRTIHFIALHRTVLIVAPVNDWGAIDGDPNGHHRGDWAAYCVPIPGVRGHREEAEAHVGPDGVKLSEAQGRALLPRLAAELDAKGIHWRR